MEGDFKKRRRANQQRDLWFASQFKPSGADRGYTNDLICPFLSAKKLIGGWWGGAANEASYLWIIDITAN